MSTGASGATGARLPSYGGRSALTSPCHVGVLALVHSASRLTSRVRTLRACCVREWMDRYGVDPVLLLAEGLMLAGVVVLAFAIIG
jgi:hypothetical protein